MWLICGVVNNFFSGNIITQRKIKDKIKTKNLYLVEFFFKNISMPLKHGLRFFIQYYTWISKLDQCGFK